MKMIEQKNCELNIFFWRKNSGAVTRNMMSAHINTAQGDVSMSQQYFPFLSF